MIVLENVIWSPNLIGFIRTLKQLSSAEVENFFKQSNFTNAQLTDMEKSVIRQSFTPAVNVQKSTSDSEWWE